MILNYLRFYCAHFSVFAGKTRCKTTPLDNVFTIRAKAFILVKLQGRTCWGGKKIKKPNPISGDLHNSVDMASALMIPCKWSKIGTQKVINSQPASTLFSSSFVSICLLLGAPDLRRVLILPGHPLNSGILPSRNSSSESLHQRWTKCGKDKTQTALWHP